MRCYLVRRGHIVSVRELPGLSEIEAVDFARHLFSKYAKDHDGFEVWDRSRMIAQHPLPTPLVVPAPPAAMAVK